ncbi:MAG: hypothetical protein ACJAY8_000119 [Sphingobacteriales bacterium]|jgi:hypothetical protein
MEPKLNFPPLEIRTRDVDRGVELWDPLRKGFFLEQPEEWVRQKWIAFLNQHQDFPLGLGNSEVPLNYLGQPKRCDIIWYNKAGEPVLLVECKRPSVKITQKVFDQIGIYNLHFKVPFLLVSNGVEHFMVKVDFEQKKFHKMQKIVHWTDVQD